jgi:two-component system cell cycle sensor histidine kinase/response regulator CckA
MSEATQARIFEPAFTTKSFGHGLGLAVVRGVIARHHGKIEVRSAPGAGTTFRIELPLLRSEVALAEVRTRETFGSSVRRDGGTLLIVDDNAAVRRTSAALLNVAGFDVLEAENGAAARDIVASGRWIDAAVVDLLMPDADGLALIEELRATRPGLKAVVCSAALDRLPRERPDLVVLEKPFRYAQLIEAVRRCIDGSANGTDQAAAAALAASTLSSR